MTDRFGTLGVTPESVFLLKANEPIAEYDAMDDVTQVCVPQEGLKVTSLLRH